MKSILRATVLLAVVFFVSCSAEKKTWKNAWYIQNAQFDTFEQIDQNGQIRIKPLDRLTIVVNSRTVQLLEFVQFALGDADDRRIRSQFAPDPHGR